MRAPGDHDRSRPWRHRPGRGGLRRCVEKDLVLSFAQQLKKKLEDSGRYRVVMTRDQDVFISLGDRVRAARATQADLFISIHADSISGGQEVRGLTVYTGSERASDADSARLADRENKADAVAGVESGDMPDDVSGHPQELTLAGNARLFPRLRQPPRRRVRFRGPPQQEPPPAGAASRCCGRTTCRPCWSSLAISRARRISTC